MSVYMVVVAQMPERKPGSARSEYSSAVAELVKKYGGEYLVRGGPAEILEGIWPDRQRLVISRWPDIETANAFWNSEEYQTEVKPLRDGLGILNVWAVAGLDDGEE